MSEVKLLTAEEIAAMRDELSRMAGPTVTPWERIVATLEALMAERDEWHAAADEWARAYNEVIEEH